MFFIHLSLFKERDELMSFSRKITLNELYGVDRVPHPLVKLITRLIRSML